MPYLNIHAQTSIQFIIAESEEPQYLYDLLPFEKPTLDSLITDHYSAHHFKVFAEEWQDLLLIANNRAFLLLTWKMLDNYYDDPTIVPSSLRIILPGSEHSLACAIAHLIAIYQVEAQGYIYDNEGTTPFSITLPLAS